MRNKIDVLSKIILPGKIIIFFLFVLICFFASAQKNKYSVTVAPAFLSPFNVGIQTGFQVELKEPFSLGAQIAFPVSSITETDYDKFTTFRATAELKYYFLGRNHSNISFSGFKKSNKRIKNNFAERPSFYLAFQSGYVIRNLTEKDSGIYYYKNPSLYSGTKYYNATIKSPVVFALLKAGHEFEISENFYVDAFAGMGVRGIFTKYKTQFEKSTTAYPSKDALAPRPSWEFNYTQFRFHITMGFCLGYRF